MSILTMSPVGVCHTFKYFYLGIDMLNDDTPARKPLVIGLSPFGQRMVFTFLYRDETVRMIVFYSQVSKIGVKRNRIAYILSNRVFIYLEIMFASFGLLRVNDFQSVPLDYYLGLQRMTLFFPE
jgi:hypothetical protein